MRNDASKTKKDRGSIYLTLFRVWRKPPVYLQPTTSYSNQFRFQTHILIIQVPLHLELELNPSIC